MLLSWDVIIYINCTKQVNELDTIIKDRKKKSKDKYNKFYLTDIIIMSDKNDCCKRI